ncbi:hypothetical protein STEG23_017456, partial [Scotinomys teguina]
MKRKIGKKGTRLKEKGEKAEVYAPLGSGEREEEGGGGRRRKEERRRSSDEAFSEVSLNYRTESGLSLLHLCCVCGVTEITHISHHAIAFYRLKQYGTELNKAHEPSLSQCKAAQQVTYPCPYVKRAPSIQTDKKRFSSTAFGSLQGVFQSHLSFSE